MLNYNKHNIPNANKLRNNMTEEELILWSKLKSKQLKNAQFNRQKPIGNYIVDFYCHKSKLIIELDGSQHYEASNLYKDKIRDQYFHSIGITVLRFTNLEIRNNLKNVLATIFMNLKD